MKVENKTPLPISLSLRIQGNFSFEETSIKKPWLLIYPNVDTEGSLLPATGRIKADCFVKMSLFVFQGWNNMGSLWTWKSRMFKVVRDWKGILTSVFTLHCAQQWQLPLNMKCNWEVTCPHLTPAHTSRADLTSHFPLAMWSYWPVRLLPCYAA